MARFWLRSLLVATWLGTAAAHDAVPELTFATNPDPARCGRPVPMGAGYEGLVHATFDGAVGEEAGHLVDARLRAEVPVPDLDVASERGARRRNPG